jgi:hypothetical protein
LLCCNGQRQNGSLASVHKTRFARRAVRSEGLAVVFDHEQGKVLAEGTVVGGDLESPTYKENLLGEHLDREYGGKKCGTAESRDGAAAA